MLRHPEDEDEDEERQNGEMQFFENNSTFEFFTFWFSYCT